MKLHDVLVDLEAAGDPREDAARSSGSGTTGTMQPLGDDADWRQNAELVFEFDQGPTAACRGFHGCEAGGERG